MKFSSPAKIIVSGFFFDGFCKVYKKDCDMTAELTFSFLMLGTIFLLVRPRMHRLQLKSWPERSFLFLLARAFFFYVCTGTKVRFRVNSLQQSFLLFIYYFLFLGHQPNIKLLPTFSIRYRRCSTKQSHTGKWGSWWRGKRWRHYVIGEPQCPSKIYNVPKREH